MTVSFTDMRGFTRMAEQLAPEQVRETINAYLEEAIAGNGRAWSHGGPNRRRTKSTALYGAPRMCGTTPGEQSSPRWISSAESVGPSPNSDRSGRSCRTVSVDSTQERWCIGNSAVKSRQGISRHRPGGEPCSRLCGAARAGEILLDRGYGASSAEFASGKVGSTR
jgi:hypothetical protein